MVITSPAVPSRYLLADKTQMLEKYEHMAKVYPEVIPVSYNS
jgi:hypothetical protein